MLLNSSQISRTNPQRAFAQISHEDRDHVLKIAKTARHLKEQIFTTPRLSDGIPEGVK